MIKILKNNEIDFKKYNECLEKSVQKNFYAKREILDHLCESWELLIWNDYQYMMPVPIKRKLGLKFAVMPLFCQQLGIFGEDQNAEIEVQFFKFLQNKYSVISYSFNFQNSFPTHLKKKKNYFIEPKEYKILRKDYFKGRKSTVKTAQYLNFAEVKLTENIQFIQNHFKGLDKKNDVRKFFNYLLFLDRKNLLKIFGSFKDQQLTNLAILVDSENRYSLLGLINDEKFKLDNGASFLIDRILQENIHQKSFDFMGGSIRGIEVFFKSFGAELQEYPIIENSKKDLLRNFFKK